MLTITSSAAQACFYMAFGGIVFVVLTPIAGVLVDRYAVIPMGLSSFTAAPSVDYRFYLSIFFIFIATLNYFVQYGNHDHHRVVHTVQTKKKKDHYKTLK